MTQIDPDRAPIFIVGSGRSGTTLLRQILNSHPHIHITQEAGFYLGSEFVPARANTSDWIECYFRSYFFAGLNIDPEIIRKDLNDRFCFSVPKKNIADAYRAIMRCVASQYGKYRFGDKTPLHTLYLNRIFKDFPDARVIHIVRDPRATIFSLSQMPWAPGSISLNIGYYHSQLANISKFRDRILEIRLEDLTIDTAGTLKKVLHYVGEPWHTAVLNHTKYAPVDDMRSYPWLQGVTQPIKQPSDQWQRKLDSEWVWLIEKINHRFLRQYGYPLTSGKLKHPSIRAISIISADLVEAIKCSWRLVVLIRKLAGRYPAPPQEIEKLLMEINSNAESYVPPL